MEIARLSLFRVNKKCDVLHTVPGKGLAGLLARYAKHNANFVLVVSGSLKLKAKSTEKVIEVVYDFLVKAVELSSLVRLKFGVCPVGLK